MVRRMQQGRARAKLAAAGHVARTANRGNETPSAGSRSWTSGRRELAFNLVRGHERDPFVRRAKPVGRREALLLFWRLGRRWLWLAVAAVSSRKLPPPCPFAPTAWALSKQVLL